MQPAAVEARATCPPTGPDTEAVVHNRLVLEVHLASAECTGFMLREAKPVYLYTLMFCGWQGCIMIC